MTLVAIEVPQKDVNGHISKWQAVHMPITYKYQRIDANVLMKFKPGILNVIIKISGSTALAVVGDTIQYHSVTGDVYNYTITAVNGQNIHTDGTIAGTEYGGFVIFLDAKVNYYVLAEFYEVTPQNDYVKIGEARYRMGLTGIITLNPSEYLKTKAVYQNNFPYDVINKLMNGESGQYTVRVTEQFTGSSETVVDVTGRNYWTNSAKQIQEIYGTNMGDFVPTPDDTRDDRAKFVTAFVKPTYFVGFPFSLSFIYSDNVTNLQLTREEETKDINGSTVATTSDALDYTQRRYLNRLMLKQSYPTTVKTVDVWLNAGSAVTSPDVTDDDYVATGTFEPSPPSPSDAEQPVATGEIKIP